MDQIHYIISDAAKRLHVEPHVLRYWEEELNLKIPRNKMGHRQYGERELELFRQIMRWKEEGLSLKEIEKKCIRAGATFATLPPVEQAGQVIPYPQENTAAAIEAADTARVEDERMAQFKQILGRIVGDAIRNNSDELTTDIASRVSSHVNKELDFLFREKEEADEKRFRQIDETIRSFQKARQEAAAAQIKENKAKSKHKFGKK